MLVRNVPKYINKSNRSKNTLLNALPNQTSKRHMTVLDAIRHINTRKHLTIT